mmetsp:Transcript_4639/g.6949  ORF Transcript_4639/g.6949 Transcript_4639/m.6949 type:complete len:250 (-) Transcript_4639:181-930(-)
MTTFLSIIVILFLSQLSTSFGILVCENGLYCASDEDCPIGNHCIDFVDGEESLTRCVPRDDFDDTTLCALSQKSCESLPCCSGLCDISKRCRPLHPPNCSMSNPFMSKSSPNLRAGVSVVLTNKKNKRQPTKSSSRKPKTSEQPVLTPTKRPIAAPSDRPSRRRPTFIPSKLSVKPSVLPSRPYPTDLPISTSIPSSQTSAEPTVLPSAAPSQIPTAIMTTSLTIVPSPNMGSFCHKVTNVIVFVLFGY